MNNSTQEQEKTITEPHEDPLDSTTQADVPHVDTDGACSAQNILLWTAYLPEDCVKAMIKMGWDRTT
jgi:hypothetical protein